MTIFFSCEKGDKVYVTRRWSSRCCCGWREMVSMTNGWREMVSMTDGWREMVSMTDSWREMVSMTDGWRPEGDGVND